MKDLLVVTGYVRGGCSPVGDEKVVSNLYRPVGRNPGIYDCQRRKIGMQILIEPEGFTKHHEKEFASLSKGPLNSILVKGHLVVGGLFCFCKILVL